MRIQRRGDHRAGRAKQTALSLAMRLIQKQGFTSVRAPRLRVGRPIRNGVSSGSKVEKKLYSGLFSAVVGTLSGVSRVVAIHPLIHSIPQPWVHQSFGPVLALWRDEFLHPRPQPI